MKMVVYILSAVALALGVVYLISTLSAPSLDPAIFMRDLSISVVAIAVGVAAPLLMRKFSAQGKA